MLTEEQPEIERLVATFSPISSEGDEDSNDEGSVASGNTATSSPIFVSFVSREELAEQKREQAQEIGKLCAQLDRRDTELLIKDNLLLMAKEERRKLSATYANLSQFRETRGSWIRTGLAFTGSSSGQGSFVFQLKVADLPQLKSLHVSSLDTYVRQVRTIVSSIPPAERTMELGRVIENLTNFHPDLQAEIDLIVQSPGKRPNDWLQLEIGSLDALVKLLRENWLHVDPVDRAREEYGKLLALVYKGPRAVRRSDALRERTGLAHI